MSRLKRIVKAFIIAVIFVASAFVGGIISKSLLHLPFPWNGISNGVIALAGLTYVVYLITDKKK